MAQKNEQALVEKTQSERFMAKAVKEWCSLANCTEEAFTPEQKSLIVGYFSAINNAMKIHGSANWSNVDMQKCAMEVARCAKIGLDASDKNMVTPQFYWNSKKNVYDFKMQLGYNGQRFKAERYAKDAPAHTIIQTVYKNDEFSIIKRDFNHPCDSYTFQIPNPDDRGDFRLVFAYHSYEDETKNQLIFLSKKDVDKRMAKSKTSNVWGEWYDEMAFKTMVNYAFSEKFVPVDPSKKDDDFMYLQNSGMESAELSANEEADENANSTPIDVVIEESEIVESENGEDAGAGF